MITCKEGRRELTLSDLKPTKQYAVLHKGGSYSFQSDKPVGDDVVACFDLAHSERPLSEDFFDENRQYDKQMKTYNTYQEAKIANPECEIVTTSQSWDGAVECIGTFEPLKAHGPRHVIADNAWVKCNPADYCMTVEEFLKAGHKFVGGDLWVDYDGDFMTVGKIGANHMNKPHERDFERYILRAAALEKPKRTKIDFVKVDDSIFDLKDEFERGELYCKHEHAREFTQIINTQTLAQSLHGNYCFKRVETEIDERQEFIDAACNEVNATLDSYAAEDFAKIYDSGKFKLVN